MVRFGNHSKETGGLWSRVSVLFGRAIAMRFGRDVAVLVSMTAVAQIIPLAVSPVLTRLFTPADFGILALYLAGTMLASIVAAGRYDLAVTLADNEEDADALVLLGSSIAVGLGLVCGIIFLAFGPAIAATIGHPELGLWVLSFPIGLTLTGIANVLLMRANREGAYGRMGRNRMLQSLVTAVIGVVLGMAGIAYPALLIGAVAGLAVGVLALLIPFVTARARKPAEGTARTRMRRLAGRFRNLPTHVMPGQLVGVFAMQLPVFVVGANYGVATAGFFSLAWRVVSVPSGLIGNALGEIYRQHAVDDYRAQGRFDRLFVRTLGMTALLGLAPLLILLAFAPPLFAFVFGEQWRVAGDYARILSLAAFTQFACLPVDKSALITGRTGYIFAWNVVMAVAMGGLGLLVYFWNISIVAYLGLYSAVMVVAYGGDSVLQYLFSQARALNGKAAQ